MSVYLYDKVNAEAIKKLSFIDGSFGFAYTDTDAGKARLGVIHAVTQGNYEKIKKLMAGKEEKLIGKKDRVFVLSGCKVPQFKIKDFLRQQKAVMTDTIEDATIFVGNSRVEVELAGYTAEHLNSLNMLFKSMYVRSQVVAEIDKSDKVVIDPVYEQFFPKNCEEVRLSKSASNKLSEYCNFKSGGWKEAWFITPYAMNLTYNILSKKIPTISDDCLLKQLPTSSKLDADICERIMSMYQSSDEENHKIANEILANCDYAGSELYLYKIARHHFHKICSSRYKNVKLFIEASKLGRFAGMSEDRFLKEANNRGEINKEGLDALLPVILKKLSNMITGWSSNVYNVKLELRPDFDKVLGDHSYNKVIEINKSTEDEDDSV